MLTSLSDDGEWQCWLVTFSHVERIIPAGGDGGKGIVEAAGARIECSIETGSKLR